MYGKIYIDRFTSFDELPKKYWGDETKVLEHLTVVGRVSTFEMDAKLHNTLKRLEAKGKIAEQKAGYPWHVYNITDNATKGVADNGKNR